VIALRVHFLGTETEDSLVDIDPKRNLRSRRSMLARVRTIWIQGVLERSLDRIARIDLGLEERPEAVDHPWDILVQQPDRAARSLPSGTSVASVFDQVGGTLLILGAPGAGKTTMLLELTRELLTRAERDQLLPMPVVFHLSSWAAQRQSLDDWLVDELSSVRYKVPRDIAEAWLATEQILPLLDGLDEVALEHRTACAEAINEFHGRHGLLPLVVCSRVADYEALSVQLQLHSAILIEPLSRPQVEQYLDRLGESLSGLRSALVEDPTLWELLRTPLLLSVAILTYQGKRATDVPSVGTLVDRRTQLLAAFVDRMFQRRTADSPYTLNQTVRWLCYVAQGLGQRWLTVFYIGLVTLDWLPTRLQRRFVTLSTALPAGLLFGLSIGRLTQLLFGSTAGFILAALSGTIGITSGRKAR
jgi:hypothetical protein